MRIIGSIYDAEGETPISGAKIVLIVDSIDRATIHTSLDGKFELEQDLAKFKGRDLICRVSKKDYFAKEATFKIDEENLIIDLELIAEEPAKPPPPTPDPIDNLIGVTDKRFTGKILVRYFLKFLVLLLVVSPTIIINPVVASVVYGILFFGFILFVMVAAIKEKQFAKNPVENLIGTIIDKGNEISGSRDVGYKNLYFITLKFEDDRRERYKVEKPVYNQLAANDRGIAYVKGEFLIGFQRTIPNEGRAEHSDKTLKR